MVILNLPPFDMKIREEDEKTCVFDSVRKKWVALTPEENVRQHFVAYLINQKNYPASHIANEASISLNSMKRRCDSVIYDNSCKPKVIIEYKAHTVKINSNIFDQISRYNIVLKVDYLIVSNGMKHYCVKMDYENNSYVFLENIPSYNEL
jgi:hypothetical protein